MQKNNYDVIVVGAGASGLYAALHLDTKLKVLLLSKRELSLSNSSLAQGGIAAVYDKKHDTVEEHIHDTLVAGGFANDKNHVDILTNEGPNDVIDLMEKYNVDFDRNPDGTPNLTLEGGHNKPRILHYKDCSGKEIVDKLIIAVKKYKNITILENHICCDLQKTNDTFHLDVIDQQSNHTTYNSHFVIMCTGGIGRVYEYTTNSAIATGDGITLAYRLGATIKNLHLVQFHPTAFANKHTRESFLISESVRGEGAVLKNCNHERFMHNYDQRLELAPRDVVSRSIMKEAHKTQSSEFYLDITHKDAKFITNRFPMIYASLMVEGYDLTKDLIPIFPCQHYLMGGIDVDDNSKTTIDGLYACGECSHTGVHGNNRLASNSLLEAVVFSRRCAT
ncbi:MAG: FAD-dependent oxidoreductase, partial [Oscillospiraceae bacterium]